MKRIIHSQEHLIQVNRRSAQRTIGIAAFLVACIGFATPALITRAATATAPVLQVVSMTANSAVLQWTPGDPGVGGTNFGYNVAVNYQGVGSTPPGTTVYTATGLNCNQSYNFYVTLVYGNGLSAESNHVQRSTDPCNTPPSVPQNVSAAATSSTQIRVAWSQSTDNSTPAASIRYHVFRNNSEVALKLGSEICSSACAYTDSGLQPGTNYSYFIKADDYLLMSGASATAGAKTSQASSPAPIPATPRPATATTNPTQKVVGKTNPAPAGQPGAALTVPAADTQPPSAPADFTAQASGSHAVVNLAWTVSSDNVAVSSYHLERSIDQVSWEDLPLQGLPNAYEDDGVGFGIQYYYRLQAKDAAGNVSPTVTAKVATAGFESTSGDGDVTYESPDKLARVLVPASAFQEPANCSLDTISGTPGRGTNEHPVVVTGPYRLLCKTASGETLGNSDQPLTWTLMLKGQLKGLTKPAVIVYDENDQVSDTKEAFSVQKDGTIVFASSSVMAIASAASRISYAWVGYVVGAIILILLVMLGAWFTIRHSQKVNYSDYLRSKYYDI